VDLAARVASSIRKPFPGSPPADVIAIAAYATVRAAVKWAETPPERRSRKERSQLVIASIRRNHTHYEELLMSGSSRVDARDAVRDNVPCTLGLWRKSAS